MRAKFRYLNFELKFSMKTTKKCQIYFKAIALLLSPVLLFDDKDFDLSTDHLDRKARTHSSRGIGVITKHVILLRTRIRIDDGKTWIVHSLWQFVYSILQKLQSESHAGLLFSGAITTPLIVWKSTHLETSFPTQQKKWWAILIADSHQVWNFAVWNISRINHP